MSEQLHIASDVSNQDIAQARQWLAQVLTNFAKAEQAIGGLCITLDLPIKNGALTSMRALRDSLIQSGDRRCKNLERRIERWQSLRPVRHLMAHGTLQVLYDSEHEPVFVTRHLPLDRDDVTPDRVWTDDERRELARVTDADARSIHDQVRNIKGDTKVLGILRRNCSL